MRPTTLPRPHTRARTLVVLAAAVLTVQCKGREQLHEPSRLALPIDRSIDQDVLDELLEPDSNGLHLWVELARPPRLADFQQLAKEGVELIDLCQATTYVAYLAPSTRPDRGTLGELVDRVGRIDAELKLEQRLVAGDYAPWALRPDGRIALVVAVFQDVAARRAREALARAGAAGATIERALAGNVYHVVAPTSSVRDLAALDVVHRIELGPAPVRPRDEQVRLETRTEDAQSIQQASPPTFTGYTGQGIHVLVCDFGIGAGQAPMLAWDQVTDRVTEPRQPEASHGLEVASVLAGNGAGDTSPWSPAILARRGHAPAARIGDAAWTYGDADVLATWIADHDTNVSNHSYDHSLDGTYTIETRLIDQLVRGDAVTTAGAPVPARPQVWAVGNDGKHEGYYSIRAPAKNAIAVGATVKGGTREVRVSSGIGPTPDGRIKPDVVATGSQILCAVPFGTGGQVAYLARSGTSYAAPAVTGIVALMMEAVQAKAGLDPDGLRPSTYRALLVHTADDLERPSPGPLVPANVDTGVPLAYGAGPDHATGFGFVDALEACETIADPDLWLENTLPFDGSFHVYTLQVPPATPRLRVTLAWDDLAGGLICPAGQSRLVNDLDLELTDPTGVAHAPWTLPPPVAQVDTDGPIDPASLQDAVPGEDHANNVEVVDVEQPASGTWKVRVRAFRLPFGHVQPYSLVAPLPLTYWVPDLALDVCKEYPHLCGMLPEPPLADVEGGWRLGPNSVFPLRLLERETPERRRCGEMGWMDCQGFELRITGLPDGATVVLFDDGGRLLGTASVDDRDARLVLARTSIGASYFFGVVDATGGALEHVLEFGARLRALD